VTILVVLITVARMRALGPQQQRNIIGPTEVKDLMRIFSDIFKRIANIQFDPEDEANVKGFYGYVWSCHVESMKQDFYQEFINAPICLLIHPVSFYSR